MGFFQSYFRFFLTTVICVSISSIALGQETTHPDYGNTTYYVKKSTETIELDAILEEEIWNKSFKVKLDYESKPEVNDEPPAETTFHITYTKNNLYVAFKALDPSSSDIRAHLMDRDMVERMSRDDYVGFRIDPFNNGQWAYQFTINPMGVQADAILDDQTGSLDYSWNAIWESKGRITATGYIVEVRIPFSSFSSPSDSIQTWQFDAFRSYPRNIRYMMLSHPVDLNNSSKLAQFDKIKGFNNISPGLNLELNPIITSQRIDRRKSDSKSLEKGPISFQPGLNVRWGIRPNMDLSATINPDYSQIELDALRFRENARFVLSYPEKRPFFLEGSEIFDTPLNAVFTRSILEPDGGVKITGKTGPQTFGFFATRDRKNRMLFPSNQSSSQIILNEPVYSEIFRYRYHLDKGGNIGVLAEGRQAEDGTYSNNVAGIDGFFRILDSNTFQLQYLHSNTDYGSRIAQKYNQPDESFPGNAFKLSFNHNSRNWQAQADFSSISSDFRNDNGFFPRANLRSYGFRTRHILRGSEDRWFSSIKTGPSYYLSTDQSGTWTDKALSYAITYNGVYQSEITAEINWGGRRVEGILFDNQWWYQFGIGFQPSVAFSKLYLYVSIGDEVDFVNIRPSKDLIVNPSFALNFGRNLTLELDPRYHSLSYNNISTFKTYLLDTTLIYHLSKKMFVRGKTQYRFVNRNLSQYDDPSAFSSASELFYYQLLFSYKLNPQSKLFLGYSSGYDELNHPSLRIRNRAGFLKVSYAWVL